MTWENLNGRMTPSPGYLSEEDSSIVVGRGENAWSRTNVAAPTDATSTGTADATKRTACGRTSAESPETAPGSTDRTTGPMRRQNGPPKTTSSTSSRLAMTTTARAKARPASAC